MKNLGKHERKKIEKEEEEEKNKIENELKSINYFYILPKLISFI